MIEQFSAALAPTFIVCCAASQIRGQAILRPRPVTDEVLKPKLSVSQVDGDTVLLGPQRPSIAFLADWVKVYGPGYLLF